VDEAPANTVAWVLAINDIVKEVENDKN